MKKFKNSLAALAGLTALVVAVPLLMPFVGLGSNTSGGNASTNQTQNVLVVNTGQQPVPVTGSATVTGTVQAEQSGTWNVGINGTPTVGLASGSSVGVSGTVGIDSQTNTVKIDGTTPVPVRDADNPARQPFLTILSVFLSDGQDNGSSSFVVPDGKILVIEHVSTEVGTATGQSPLVRLSGCNNPPTCNGFSPIFSPTLVKQPGDFVSLAIQDRWVGNDPTRLYMPSSFIGSTALLTLIRNANTGNAFVSVTITGYLVNTP